MQRQTCRENHAHVPPSHDFVILGNCEDHVVARGHKTNRCPLGFRDNRENIARIQVTLVIRDFFTVCVGWYVCGGSITPVLIVLPPPSPRRTHCPAPLGLSRSGTQTLVPPCKLLLAGVPARECVCSYMQRH